MEIINFKRTLLMASMLTFLSACGDDMNNVALDPGTGEPEMEYIYQMQVTNLTYGQPFSPPTLIASDETKLWQVGESASDMLEHLAEGGDNSALLANYDSSVSSEAPLPPGQSVNLTLSSSQLVTHINLLTMLVNTNDAFSGLTGVDISDLSVTASKSWTVGVYDAGTEANSELAGTIPGPVDGGVGFDMQRDDSDRVSIHSGVVTADDGLLESVLTQAQRFDNPAMKLTITRMQ